MNSGLDCGVARLGEDSWAASWSGLREENYRQNQEDGGAYQADIVSTQEKPHGLWGVTDNQAFSFYIF